MSQQIGEQLLGCRVRPVDVIEDKHERSAGAERLQHHPHCPIGSIALFLQWRWVLRVLADKGGKHARQLGNELRRGDIQLREAARKEAVVQGMHEHAEGQVRLELGSPALQHQATPLFCTSAELSEQAGLTETRLPGDLHHAPGWNVQRVQRLVQCRQLGVAPNELRSRRASGKRMRIHSQPFPAAPPMD